MENISRANKKVSLNTVINWGASIVIIGLTFKLLHWEGGEWMIAIGLLTEACLFFMLGYATLSEQNNTQVQVFKSEPAYRDKSVDDLLTTSIDKQVIEKLKNGFEQFNKTVASVNSITDSTKTTQEMVREIEKTTQEVQILRRNLEELNTVYRAQLEAFRKS
jgi:hypothetical protein